MKITKRQLRRVISELGPANVVSDPDWHPNMSQEYEAGGVLSDKELYQRSFKESTMKISRRQLRRMIRESWDDPLRPDDDEGGGESYDDSQAHELLNKYEDGEISDKDFVYHIDTLARSVNYVPLSQERIDASYTVEDYVNDLGHQLLGRM